MTAVLGARLTYGLPYYWSRMTVRATGRRRIHYITVDVGEALAEPDDLTVFLTERYRLYTSFRGRLAVEHERWPSHRAAVVGFEELVRPAANLPTGDASALVHYSPGVHVRIGTAVPKLG